MDEEDSGLMASIKAEGTKGASQWFGNHDIDWENDPLIFIQVFCRVPECGHWALLIVIDRTVDKLG